MSVQCRAIVIRYKVQFVKEVDIFEYAMNSASWMSDLVKTGILREMETEAVAVAFMREELPVWMWAGPGSHGASAPRMTDFLHPESAVSEALEKGIWSLYYQQRFVNPQAGLYAVSAEIYIGGQPKVNESRADATGVDENGTMRFALQNPSGDVNHFIDKLREQLRSFRIGK